MTIADKLSRLRAINLRTLFDDVLKENEDYICNLNKDQMYEEGIMNVRTKQKQQYAESTKISKRKAPFNKTDFITLRWFGNFYESLRLIIFKDYFIIQSPDKVWGSYLETQTRFTSALGLTKESKSELRNLAKDELIKKIRSGL
ncbi:MAG: hypothetical protein M0R74_20435 [Dehalococcoidia bacterium]|nr:hypothetical protein [Dehalococcoidia bacterium]